MDRTEKDISILEHIVKHCSEMAETHKQFGDKYEIFQDNKPYFKAVAMDLLQIGELANHLSKKFQEKYADIPYPAIISLRNIVAHGYGKLRTENMWKISHENVPPLQKRCLEIIKENEKQELD